MSAPWVVAVGGADPTAAAGVHADVRTIERTGGRPAAVVTAITVQTGTRVTAVRSVDARLVRQQLVAVLDTLPIVAVKCGLLPQVATVRAVAAEVEKRNLVVVVDPVLSASTGHRLASLGVSRALVSCLLFRTTVITANLAEASVLTGVDVSDEASMVQAARRLADLGAAAVVVKGGHLSGDPVDILWHEGRVERFRGRRIENRDVHGTGCAYASALAVGLARGLSMTESVRLARRHVRQLIEGASRWRHGAWLRGATGRGGR